MDGTQKTVPSVTRVLFQDWDLRGPPGIWRNCWGAYTHRTHLYIHIGKQKIRRIKQVKAYKNICLPFRYLWYEELHIHVKQKESVLHMYMSNKKVLKLKIWKRKWVVIFFFTLRSPDDVVISGFKSSFICASKYYAFIGILMIESPLSNSNNILYVPPVRIYNIYYIILINVICYIIKYCK